MAHLSTSKTAHRPATANLMMWLTLIVLTVLTGITLPAKSSAQEPYLEIPFIPGKDNNARWKLFSKHCDHLIGMSKAQARKIFGNGWCESLSDNRQIVSYKISETKESESENDKTWQELSLTYAGGKEIVCFTVSSCGTIEFGR